jgi:hypothetical protein
VNGSDIHNAFTALGITLVILAEASITSQPSKGAFDHPAAWQNLKADLVRSMFNNVKNHVECFTDPINQATILVDNVCLELLQT